MPSPDVLLHPVRMRILQTFVAESTQTARQVATALQDVAPATLYRHLGVLVRGGVLEVVGEVQRRGAVERTYALADGAARVVGSADLRGSSRADQLRYFGMFLSGLFGEFGRYLATRPGDLARDGVGYRSASAYLSDAETRTLLQRIEALLVEAQRRPPSRTRRLRLIARVSMPLSRTTAPPRPVAGAKTLGRESRQAGRGSM